MAAKGQGHGNSRKMTFARLSLGGKVVRAADGAVMAWCPRHLREHLTFLLAQKKSLNIVTLPLMQKSGLSSNHDAAGQVDPRTVRITMVPCLLAVWLLLKRFFSSLVCFAGSSAMHTLRKNICCFFMASDPRRAAVTWRMSHSSIAQVRWGTFKEAEVEVFRPLQPTCLTQDLDLCARWTFHWFCGASCYGPPLCIRPSAQGITLAQYILGEQSFRCSFHDGSTCIEQDYSFLKAVIIHLK